MGDIYGQGRNDLERTNGSSLAMTNGPTGTATAGADPGIRADPAVLRGLPAPRRDLLRSLHGGRKTDAELARELRLPKAAVTEHLDRLTDAGMVARVDDDREWMYHELTPSGRAILETEGSRMFQVFGVILLGLLAAIMMMGLYYYLVEMPGGGLVAIEPSATSFITARPVDFTIEKTQGLDPDPAYLESTAGRRARLVVQDAGDAWRLRSEGAMAPGAYRLRFQDTEPTFNAPPMIVHAVHVTAPNEQWWRGLDGDLVLNVSANGRPLNGVLFLEPEESVDDTFAARLPSVVQDGVARFPVALLDPWATGPQKLLFEADPNIGAVEADGTLTVVAPRPEVAPRVLVAGSADDVRLFLAVRGGEEPERVPVRIDGSRVQGEPVSAHHLRVPLDASAPGVHALQVGRLANITVTVLPDLAIAVTVEEGPRWRMQVSDAGGALAGLAVSLDGRGIGKTDADGELSLDVPPRGTHAFTFHTTVGPSNRTFASIGSDLVERRPDIHINVLDENIIGRSVAVAVTNGDAVAHEATLVGSSAGGWSARAAHLDADANGTLRLDLYPPMGGALDIYMTVPAYRPITFTNGTGTDVTEPVEDGTAIHFGRIVTAPQQVDVPQQSTPPPHEEERTLPSPEPLPQGADDGASGRARTVFVVLGVVIVVTSLYLLRGRWS